MSLLAAETDFALNLLRQTPAAESTVFSPLSIAIALSVLFSGAKDKTKSEIGNAILKGANATELENHYGQFVNGIRSANNIQVDIATRFFLDDGFSIREDYRNLVQEQYNADAVSLDFADTVQAAKIVNDHINATTHGMIPNLVNSDMLAGTVAVLVNAVYLKAKWRTVFNRVEPGDFFLNNTFSRKVGLMNLGDPQYLPYAANDQLRLVKLPYEEGDFDFAVILPKKRFGLHDLRENITGNVIQDLFSNAKSTWVKVILPKFRLEKNLELKSMLSALGVNSAFSNAADFSPVTPQAFKLNNAIHEAVINVDQTGTEASAVTFFDGRYVMAIIYETEPIEFYVDQPFLFAVLYKNRPLFIGQYF